ncbi:MAG: FAD-dependent oxidoreductase [Planctomycetota bacterium]
MDANQPHDVVVLGGGISGASFAFQAARAGRRVLVLDADERPGGCLRTERSGSGFWFELGAHTLYNSYGATLELIEAAGSLDVLQERGKPVLRFLDGNRVRKGKNLGLLLRLFRLGELLRCVPRWRKAKPAGHSVRSHYSRLVGPTNYENVLGPLLSAVPSQRADDFPADMLFKKRERREDVMRSFTLKGGVERLVELALAHPGIEARCGCAATSVERAADGFAVVLADGTRIAAPVLAVATPPRTAGELLAGAFPQLAAELAGLAQTEIESLGLALRAERVDVPYATFLIPRGDRFHSVVTRDVVADPERRAFTFHFRAGTGRDAAVARACEVLGVAADAFEAVAWKRSVLPSPVLGHAEVVARVDAALEGGALALTGNWFGGLSIEDCVLRSRAEWQRVEAL